MKRIFVRTKGVDDWRDRLRGRKRQWRRGYSAWELAHRWDSIEGLPGEVVSLFAQSGVPSFEQVELLAAIAEYPVALPGGNQATFNDLLVLMKGSDGQLITAIVEGKVSEPFDETVGAWKNSKGKEQRLNGIREILGFEQSIPPNSRYQLWARTAAAIIEAKRFGAPSAVMLVHSFSPIDEGFDDYQMFLKLFGVSANPGRLHLLEELGGVKLYAGWANGHPEVRTV